jgi:hypothetical protein
MIASLHATPAFRPIPLFSGFAFVRFPMFRHSRTKSAVSSVCRHRASRSVSGGTRLSPRSSSIVFRS